MFLLQTTYIVISEHVLFFPSSFKFGQFVKLACVCVFLPTRHPRRTLAPLLRTTGNYACRLARTREARAPADGQGTPPPPKPQEAGGAGFCWPLPRSRGRRTRAPRLPVLVLVRPPHLRQGSPQLGQRRPLFRLRRRRRFRRRGQMLMSYRQRRRRLLLESRQMRVPRRQKPGLGIVVIAVLVARVGVGAVGMMTMMDGVSSSRHDAEQVRFWRLLIERARKRGYLFLARALVPRWAGSRLIYPTN